MNSYCFTGDQATRARIMLAGLLVANLAAVPSMARSDAVPREQALSALRIQVDAKQRRAWVLNHDAVYVYDTALGRLIKRIELSGWLFVSEYYSCPPDLALSPSGAALVTSNVVPTIWEIHPQSLEATKHSLSLDADDDKDMGFGGLVFGDDGKALFGVSSRHDSMWKMDLAADEAHKMPISGPVQDACGLSVFGKERVHRAVSP